MQALSLRPNGHQTKPVFKYIYFCNDFKNLPLVIPK